MQNVTVEFHYDWRDFVIGEGASRFGSCCSEGLFRLCLFKQDESIKQLNFMAFQESILKFKGTIGDLSFIKTKDGYTVRKKSGVDGDRVRFEPQYQRTRENGEEFTRAGKSSKMLRTVLRSYIKNAKDGTASNRLTRQMMKVLKGDTASLRGKREPMLGDFNYLFGFEFNDSARLTNTLKVPFTTSVDRASGVMNFSLPEFVPVGSILIPDGATHFRIAAVGVEIDLAGDFSVVSPAETGAIIIGQQIEGPIALNVNVTPQSQHALFFVVGMTFSQSVNGTLYPLTNGAFNALTIVHASKA
jgi:hypothetical protein